MRRTRTGSASLSRRLRGACLAAGMALALVGGAMAGAALLPASASATPAPIALDAPDNGTPPLVAYSPADGYTYVAWSAPDNQNEGNGVDLCVLPPGTSGCAGGSPVLLTDTNTAALGTNSSNTIGLGGLVVLPVSGEVVVLGTPVEEGTVAWASPPGGAAFLTGDGGLQNDGNFISPVSLFYTKNNAVGINGTDVGIFDSYDHFYSYFSDSPFAGPETPSTLPSNTGNANNGGQFDDQGDTQGPVIAAQPAPPPAAAGTYIVVGAGANNSSNETTPTGCINDAATGYGVDVGTTGASSTLDSQGLQPNGFGLLACSAEDPTLVSGGQDGIGVLEEEGSAISGAGSDWQMDYRPFIATATGGSFGAPVELADITSEVLDGVDAVNVSEDSGTGVYAFWEDGNTVLDYSGNGGASWEGPVASPIPYTANGVIAGVGDGAAEIAYVDNPGTGAQVFIQLVSYQQLVAEANKPTSPAPTSTAVSTSQTSGTTSGSDISIPDGTVGETDQATISGANAGTASGTAHYGLYSSSTCSTASKVLESTATVALGKAAPSAPVTTALATGKYYWQASYSGNTTNLPSESTCGSEVLTVTPAATVGGSGTSTSSSLTFTISCAAACTVTVTVELPTASAARKSKKKPKPVTLAKGTFTLPNGGTKKLTLHLTKAGRKVFAAHHGRLSASVLLSETIDGHTILSTKTVKFTPAKHKHKK